MEQKRFRRAAALALVCLLLGATAVFADTVPADGDALNAGDQKLVHIGEYAPGAIVTRNVDFTLVCGSIAHADEGNVISIQPSSYNVSLNGTVSATTTTIGPVPASWTDDGFGCPSPAPTLPANGHSVVTMRMPTTPGLGYLFTVIYARVGGNGMTGTTAISFEVDVVVPNTPPVLSLPGPISAEAASAGGTTVTYTATAIDAEDNPDPTPVCSPVSGSVFPLGTTTVSCTVTDLGNLSASGSFTVSIADTTAPALVLPGDLTAEATGPGGASVDFTTSASDAVDGAVAVNCDHASGDTFPVGTTTVTCSAVDAAGNPTSGTFDVTVSDTTSPVLALPGDLTAEATSPGGASVDFTASASDAVDGDVPVTCDHASGDTFAFGTTTVTCSAVDAAGNPTSGTFDVSVSDTSAPTLNDVPANISVTTGNPAGANVMYTMPTARDSSDPNPAVGCDHAPGSVFAVGPTTVTCTARDATGLSDSASFVVTVTYVSDVTWSALWSTPVEGAPSVLVTNQSRTIPIKVRIFANGVEQTSGSANLRVLTCGGDPALVVPLAWGSGRWNAHLDMSLLSPGCYNVIATLGGTNAGSFALEVRGPEANKTPAAATTGKDKAPKK